MNMRNTPRQDPVQHRRLLEVLGDLSSQEGRRLVRAGVVALPVGITQVDGEITARFASAMLAG